MGGIKLVLKHKPDSEELVFEMPAEPFKSRLKEVLDLCEKKTGNYCTVEINRPYKPRTTGEGSQNNLFWVLATKIAQETGEDVKEVEEDLKLKAIAKGYPYHVSKITGEPKPESMKRVNTVEMSYLIDTAYEVCAFLGIVLEPEYSKQENPTPVMFDEEEIKPFDNTVELAKQALYEMNTEEDVYEDDVPLEDIEQGELF